MVIFKNALAVMCRIDNTVITNAERQIRTLYKNPSEK